MQVAFGLLGAGGNVVVASHEFPANLYPWLRAGRAGGPEVRLVDVPDRRVGPEALAPAIDAGTRLVALSLVDYLTGYRADVEAVVAAAGDALVLVDGIQGLGAVAAGLGGADVFVAGGHKWLRAGFSTGVMAVSDRALERLEPTLSGWWAVQDNHDFEAPPPQPALDTADRFIEGSPNLPGALAAAAALEIVEREGIDTIERAVLERSEAVADVARSLGAGVFAPWKSDAERSGIATFRFGDVSSTAVVHGLAGEGFIVSERNGWIRVSPHATTPMRVIDEFADALAAQVRKA
jgi:selenocysteine lyase/cysteine desulfurase